MEVLRLPDPRRLEIEIFGLRVFLEERTAEERYQMESAVADPENEVSPFVLSLVAITGAFQCNIKQGFSNWRYNRHFRFSYLKRHLKESQIDFLIEELGKLEYGEEEYLRLKELGESSKKPLAVVSYQGKQSGA